MHGCIAWDETKFVFCKFLQALAFQIMVRSFLSFLSLPSSRPLPSLPSPLSFLFVSSSSTFLFFFLFSLSFHSVCVGSSLLVLIVIFETGRAQTARCL